MKHLPFALLLFAAPALAQPVEITITLTQNQLGHATSAKQIYEDEKGISISPEQFVKYLMKIGVTEIELGKTASDGVSQTREDVNTQRDAIDSDFPDAHRACAVHVNGRCGEGECLPGQACVDDVSGCVCQTTTTLPPPTTTLPPPTTTLP